MKVNFNLNMARSCRIMLGTALTVVGWNSIFEFLPYDSFELPARYAFGLAGTLAYSDLIMKILLPACGMLLLADIAVPLILIILFPILINLVTFQVLYVYNLFTISMMVFAYVGLVVKNYKNLKYLFMENLE